MEQCFKLSIEFERNKAELAEFLNEWKVNRKATYPFPAISPEDNTITGDIEFLLKFGKLATEKYYHKSEGYMRKDEEGNYVDITGIVQLNNLAQ